MYMYMYRSSDMSSNHCQKALDGNERNNAIERTKSTYRKKRKGEMSIRKWNPDAVLADKIISCYLPVFPES